MRRAFLIIYFIHFITAFCFGQNIGGSSPTIDTNGLFKSGLLLEDKNIIIPWGTSFKTIRDYGNPRITRVTKTVIDVSWDSVRILGGISANVIYTYSKSLLEKESATNVKMFYIDIDSSSLVPLHILLENYTHSPGKHTKYRTSEYYYWFVDGCNVKLGSFGNKFFYLRIQKVR